MEVLKELKFHLDTWEFLNLDDYQDEESVQIYSSLEETSDWRPISCEPKEVKVAFIDGVRRTEHLLSVETATGVSRAAFVSVGAGAVLMDYGRLNTHKEALVDTRVDRFFVVGKEVAVKVKELSFEWEGGRISFKVKSSEGELTNRVNGLMRDLEFEVAKSVLKRGLSFVVADGTLHFLTKKEKLPIVGYVKKHRHIYIEQEKIGILEDIKVGERTPIIRIHSQPYMEGPGEEKFDKYTWYVRISDHGGLHGFARLEVSAELGIERAVELANTLSPIIPRFASVEILDERAPQNLLPIKYLEGILRRQLGSHSLIRNVIRKELFSS